MREMLQVVRVTVGRHLTRHVTANFRTSVDCVPLERVLALVVLAQKRRSSCLQTTSGYIR